MPMFSLTILIPVLALLATIISALNIIYGDKGKKLRGWVLIGIGVSLMICTIANNTNQESKTNYYDSTVNNYKKEIANLRTTILDSLGLGNKSITSKIDSLSTIKNFQKEKIENPLLNILESPYFTISNKNDSIPISLSIKNFNAGVAKNLKEIFISLSIKNGIFKISSIIKDNTNETHFIGGQGIYSYYLHYTTITMNRLDSNIIYMNISYTNQAGKKQPPLRKLYFIPHQTQSNLIFDVRPDLFNKSKFFLIKNNLW